MYETYLHSNIVGLDTACVSCRYYNYNNLHSNIVGLDTDRFNNHTYGQDLFTF